MTSKIKIFTASLVLVLGAVLFLGAGCGKQETTTSAPPPDTETGTPQGGGTGGETKEKSVLDAKTFEEGLAKCNEEPMALCYFLLGAKFDRPDACKHIPFDPDAIKECEGDAQNGFANAKEMIKALWPAK